MDLWLGLSYCDGKWNKIILSKSGTVASAKMNEWTDHVMEPDLEQLFVNSPVYLGGTPVEVQEAFKELGLEQGVYYMESRKRLHINNMVHIFIGNVYSLNQSLHGDGEGEISKFTLICM